MNNSPYTENQKGLEEAQIKEFDEQLQYSKNYQDSDPNINITISQKEAQSKLQN